MLPILFIPGLLCSAEVFAPQLSALWRLGPVTVASTLEGTTIGEVAAKILKTAPPRFALIGLSMGGYICFEIMRQAPQRVLRLALLDTSARADTAEQTGFRRAKLQEARSSGFLAVALENLNGLLHPSRRTERSLLAINRRMALAVGLEGFERQIGIAISRPDSRPDLRRSGSRPWSLSATPTRLRPSSGARRSSRWSPMRGSRSSPIAGTSPRSNSPISSPGHLKSGWAEQYRDRHCPDEENQESGPAGGLGSVSYFVCAGRQRRGVENPACERTGITTGWPPAHVQAYSRHPVHQRAGEGKAHAPRRNPASLDGLCRFPALEPRPAGSQRP